MSILYQTIKDKNEITKINSKTLFVGISDESYYKTIQDAINASSNNDTIIIENGIYNELLTINKSIILVGQSSDNTIINYSSNNSQRQVIIINIDSDKCKIENLTVTKNTYTGDTMGVYINSSNNIIKNVKIINVSKAITIGVNKNNNILSQNQILNNLIGIQTWKSSYNFIENNIIFSNAENGIFIHTYSYENTIKNNIVINNYYGAMIKGSNNNIVYNNCFKENNYGTIICCGSSDNIVYNNIFLNNSINNSKQSADITNYWHSDFETGGNYWDDYNGFDENHDGYGDTPYVIPEGGEQDIYPLIKPPEEIMCEV